MTYSLWRCTTCGCKWRKWDDSTYSLLPGEVCKPCCDNVPMTLEEVKE